MNTNNRVLVLAGAFGLVIANNASFQEPREAVKLRLVSLCERSSFNSSSRRKSYQASQAICFVIKNMLGLLCPVAGLVEVPCVQTRMLRVRAMPILQQI